MGRATVSRATEVVVGGAARSHALEALWTAGDGEPRYGAVLAPPHPLYGGRIDSPILLALEDAMLAVGGAVLRFNWRGIGGSGGRATDDPAAAVVDYRAALAEVARRVAGPIVAGGYSWGAMSAVRAVASEPRVAALVLVAPPAMMLDGDAVAALDGDVLVLCGEHDRIAPPRRIGELLAAAPRARLVAIAGADHFFAASLGQLRDRTHEWLTRPAG